MRVALLSANAQVGDAIGNNVANKFLFFRDRAADVRAFLQSEQLLHPVLRGHRHVARGMDLAPDATRFLHSADLICAELGQYYPLLTLLPLLAGRNARIILDYHGITPPELWSGHNREPLLKGLQHRGLAWLADATITHSAFTHNELRTHTGLPPNRLPRLGFPVDCPWFFGGPTKDECRQKLCLQNRRTLLFVGRLAPNKQPTLLVEALAQLADLSPPVHAVFVGDNGDLYQLEAERCLHLARKLGLHDRVHIVGPKHSSELRDYYHAADVLVVPSQWESFCIPVIEAMAVGLPVIASRCSALPETIASAGLTFRPGDADDLARQIRRVLISAPSQRETSGVYKIAIIASRFGPQVVSGAEASLRCMALALGNAGCSIEVFTTTAISETQTSNNCPQGTTNSDQLVVHRFAAERSLPFYSARLIDALAQRVAEFDFILTGPYVSELSSAVLQRWPDRSVVVPCFHDEPAARGPTLPELFDRVAGILYHSQEEQAFAECSPGVNHPGSAVVGNHVDVNTAGDPIRGRHLVGADRYVVYSGRYCNEKNLPLLLDFAARFDAANPGLCRFVFTGTGEVAIPRQPWAVDLGVLADTDLRNVLAGASALIQLSCNESLSLVALQAWAQATPVIAHRDCPVLAGHVARGGGGLLVGDYDNFASALNSLLPSPLSPFRGEGSGVRGTFAAAGQAYVRDNFGNPSVFRDRLLAAFSQLGLPLAECMRRRGLERAAQFDKQTWKVQFSTIVERVLHAPPLAADEHLDIDFRAPVYRLSSDAKTTLVPVRVTNRGSLASLAEGPASMTLAGDIMDHEGRIVETLTPTHLPNVLMPGKSTAACAVAPAPAEPGDYNLRLWACRADKPDQPCGPEASIPITVSGSESIVQTAVGGLSMLLAEANAALIDAQRLQRLPDDYHDVTHGPFERLKRWIKQKLLGNFRKSYVDVLSRQQSACNQQLLTAVQSLAECCATLEHAVRALPDRHPLSRDPDIRLAATRSTAEPCAAERIFSPLPASGRGAGGEG